MKNDIAFIVHDAWRLRLSSGTRIMFNFCQSTLQTNKQILL